MKILVIQLARLGDIYQTWPSLRALRRSFPDGQVDLCVRRHFFEATEMLEEIHQIHVLETKELLKDFWIDGALEKSLFKSREFLESIRDEGYDQIINLSFSPMSSYMVDLCRVESTVVRGYSRQSDGTLLLPDDGSAYFYAQVGTQKYNRFHLVDVFANLCQVDLIEEDFRPPAEVSNAPCEDQPYLICHIGGSQTEKKFSATNWESVLSAIEADWDGEILLVGSQEDGELASEILLSQRLKRTSDVTGQVRLPDLFEALSGAELLIANDSVVQHMASLCALPTLNLSCQAVNFWETGPLAAESLVLWSESGAMPSPEIVAEWALCVLHDEPPHQVSSSALRMPSEVAGERFIQTKEQNRFQWLLIKALYVGTPYPAAEKPVVLTALQRLREAVHLSLDFLSEELCHEKSEVVSTVLDQVDELLRTVEKFVPEVRPLIWWFQTEMVKIGPGPVKEIFGKTREAHRSLDLILSVMTGESQVHESHQPLYVQEALAPGLSSQQTIG